MKPRMNMITLGVQDLERAISFNSISYFVNLSIAQGILRNSTFYQIVSTSENSKICLSDVTSGSPRILDVAAMIWSTESL